MIGVAVGASAGLAAAPAVGVIGAGVVVGAAVGRGVWHLLSRRSERVVSQLADELAQRAGGIGAA
jgi:hypothetical protein